MNSQKKKKAVIIGAGPAGLTAGVELLRTKKFAVDLIEKEKVVGGLARTTEYKGCRFDIGPHHFITESPKIEQWWKDVMGDDFIKHKRFTRIFYNNHFFHYPLDPGNVIRGLNFVECVKCVLSYIKIRLLPIKNVKSFQDWVTNRFGYRLFSIFFKTYTEKVWGIACHKISSDWASQRIKGFSLSKAIFYAFFGRFFKKNKPRTINDVFYYPSQGSGALWNRVAQNLTSFEQGTISLDEEVVYIEHDAGKVIAIATRKAQTPPVKGVAQRLMRYEGDYFLSTMPLRGLIMSLNPLPPGEVVDAASALQYRGLITVNLIINKTHICPDHWLYVHEKKVRMGRIGNMNNFSIKMADHPSHTALSLEYFSFVDEPFWFKSDAELIGIGKRELEAIGLVKAAAVIDGMVMRTPQAYPVYDENYKEHLGCVLDYLSQFKNLHLMGRNGLHRYNNMDIAMLSAMKAVDDILEQEKRQDREEEKIVEQQPTV
ncbi:MAG: NAD(P)/FAD-dependent oxidoreductase [Epsilonproteobacteria bacterium]|nr:NAD(P)/FAD-dependent oxidoreductase [Campylobacterota bacterium]